MKKDGVVKAMLSLVKANRGIVAAAVLALGGIGLLHGQDAADLAKYGIRRNEGDISMTQEQIEEADRYRREQWAIQQGQGNWVQVIKTGAGDVVVIQLDGMTYLVSPRPKPNLEVILPYNKELYTAEELARINALIQTANSRSNGN